RSPLRATRLADFLCAEPVKRMGRFRTQPLLPALFLALGLVAINHLACEQIGPESRRSSDEAPALVDPYPPPSSKVTILVRAAGPSPYEDKIKPLIASHCLNSACHATSHVIDLRRFPFDP